MVSYQGKKISVVGLARSGVSACLVLKEAGAAVFGSDAGASSPERLKPLADAAIPFETGRHSEKVFESDLVVVSPGVPLETPLFSELRKRRIPVIGELELASTLTLADIVAVTGSNGKSTTVSLLGELFKTASFRSRVGGNIGDALSGQVDGLDKGDVLIAEVSSFQLDTIVSFRPKAAAILNLTPDHLDRYPSEEAYYDSKMTITRNQGSDDFLVLNGDDPISLRKAKTLKTEAKVSWFSLNTEVENGACVKDGWLVLRNGNSEIRVLKVEELLLPGLHNIANVLAALALSHSFNLPLDGIRDILRTYRGIEHRIEFVREHKGVRYWNDSKGTNVDSVRVALLSMKGPVHLIAGGRDKASDFSILNDLISEKVAVVHAIGEAASKMETSWKAITHVSMDTTMESAVKTAAAEAKPGMNVLLSPACASFDQYRNYEERGRHFKKCVEAL